MAPIDPQDRAELARAVVDELERGGLTLGGFLLDVVRAERQAADVLAVLRRLEAALARGGGGDAHA